VTEASRPPASVTSGILLVDKPKGLTSHDVVSRTRKAAGTRKVGHAGTLDPMATGLLVLGLNSSTRLLTYLVGLDKEYFATIRLGQSTTTDDAEGETVATHAVAGVTESMILAGVAALTGKISQVPSSVSAIKVDGKRAYALVRAGETVELKVRAVTISAFDVVDTRVVTEAEASFIDIDVRVECSSGTYIRALARDLGADLGVGGHLTALRRTKVGPFSVGNAATLEELAPSEQLLAPSLVAATLFPTYAADTQEVIDLVHGKRIEAPGLPSTRGPIAIIAPDGRLVGLAKSTSTGAKPLVNFPTDEILDKKAHDDD
jgi:tRNA pseudouridine55 synthase